MVILYTSLSKIVTSEVVFHITYKKYHNYAHNKKYVLWNVVYVR